jgi:hypothetical protein
MINNLIKETTYFIDKACELIDTHHEFAPIKNHLLEIKSELKHHNSDKLLKDFKFLLPYYQERGITVNDKLVSHYLTVIDFYIKTLIEQLILNNDMSNEIVNQHIVQLMNISDFLNFIK